jgi:prepilin-type N-terminal cleavage/methylation domain-containing protein
VLGFNSYSRSSTGFTVIELSIVLVIIGLVLGGIFVGKDLIHTAQLRGTITQIEKYKTAVNTFRTKYNCLPGDCTTAVEAGLGTGGGAGDNGDGNGFIWEGLTALSIEGYNFWHHLSAANLVDGNFPGYANQVTTVAGVDFPRTKLGKGGIWVAAAALDCSNNGCAVLNSPYKNSFWISSVTGNHAGAVLPAVLQPIESYQIDLKLDNGRPLTGSVTLAGISGLTAWWNLLDTLNDAYGVGGATSNRCGSTDTNPPTYNIVNTSNDTGSLCVLQISAGF